MTSGYIESPDHPDLYVPHRFPEQQVDLGEIRMNYAEAGSPGNPPLLLIPGQTESWWGYEAAMSRLAADFHVFAIDLRGQGRSTWTPGRYTFDNLGNDVVRFIDLVIGRATIVSGNSSGGVVATWLSAYAKPGQVLGVVAEDPPLLAPSADAPETTSISNDFINFSMYLGNQWSIGDWNGYVAASADVPPFMHRARQGMFPGSSGVPAVPPQNLREYDPEWASASITGTLWGSNGGAKMISRVKTPILLTQHFSELDEASGTFLGAISDASAERVVEIVRAAGQRIDFRRFPAVGHAMHSLEPDLYADTVRLWAETLR